MSKMLSVCYMTLIYNLKPCCQDQGCWDTTAGELLSQEHQMPRHILAIEKQAGSFSQGNMASHTASRVKNDTLVSCMTKCCCNSMKLNDLI